MSNYGKILAVGAALVIGGIVAHEVHKNAKKDRYFNVNGHSESTNATEQETTETKAEKISKKLWDASCKKAMDILGWVGNHEQETKGIILGLQVAAAGAGLYFAIKKGLKQDGVLKQLDKIQESLDREGYVKGWQACFDETLKQMRRQSSAGEAFTFWSADGDVITKFNVQEVAA